MSSRGIRNNNPGNIRVGSDWRGLAMSVEMTPQQQEEREFCVFCSPVYGIRALTKLLLTYYRKYNLDTVEEIISRYAPEADNNNTKAYIDHVAAEVGVNYDAILDLEDRDIMKLLVDAIIVHENGYNPYKAYTVEDGITLGYL